MAFLPNIKDKTKEELDQELKRLNEEEAAKAAGNGPVAQQQEPQQITREQFEAEIQRRVQETVQQKKNLDILNNSKVIIGIPAQEKVDFRWATAFPKILNQGGYPIKCDFIPAAQYGVAETRQKIVNQFMQIPGATHLLFLDTDIIPSDFALTTLLQADKDIVSGCYYNSLYTGLAAWVGEQALDINLLRQQNPQDPLIQVDKVGLGLCLMKRDLFRKLQPMEQPWFYYRVNEGGPHSEDFYFLQLCLRAGVKPFIDLRVHGLHLKAAVVNPDKSITI
jgi:hypothetical protein